MNWGVLGVLLVALALGVGAVACWRFVTAPAVRWGPGAAVAGYYAALAVWPHPAIQALVAQHSYPSGEQARVLLLGVALLLVIVVLVRRLHQSTQANAQLRRELGRKESP
ncbi:hypothetical protein [uncultured Deinococcus sp.]|uniref:hypothetical protein n=1 Tax=uncultured Deinococcus sp. TaxID=158789 RepID=UPI0025874518|nr:hypothetical protein [uncultured Deinococcus sp.]